MLSSKQWMSWTMAAVCSAGLCTARAFAADERKEQEDPKGGLLPIIIGGASVLVGGAYIIDKESDDGSDGAEVAPSSAPAPAAASSSNKSKSSSSGGGGVDLGDLPRPSFKAGVIANGWTRCTDNSQYVFLGDDLESEIPDSRGRSYIEDAGGTTRWTILSSTLVAEGPKGSESASTVWRVVEGSLSPDYDRGGCLVLEDSNGLRIVRDDKEGCSTCPPPDPI